MYIRTCHWTIDPRFDCNRYGRSIRYRFTAVFTDCISNHRSVFDLSMFISSNFHLIVFVILIFAGVAASNDEEVAESFSSATVVCETTKGQFVIDVFKEWSPLGAERFIHLVKDGFFTDIAFFRCVDGFLTQFGISDNPDLQYWHENTIADDPNLNMGIHKNYVSFAGGGPNTRSTQIFIAFEYLDFLGNEPWETPFGVVVEGQSTLDSLYRGYGDIDPFGTGPDQQEIFRLGNQYIRDNFPKIDFLHTCEVVEEDFEEEL
jgi:peptidyl-prolyl cis-trans isomerase A (cyclophilin A)